MAFAVTRDGTTAVSGTSDGALRRWSPAAGSTDAVLLGTVEEVRSLVLTPDGRQAFVGDRHGVISLFALDGADAPRSVQGHASPVDALALTEDGELLVSGGWDATIKLWARHGVAGVNCSRAVALGDDAAGVKDAERCATY